MKGPRRPRATAWLLPELSVICAVILRGMESRARFCWAAVSVATALLACHRGRNERRELKLERETEEERGMERRKAERSRVQARRGGKGAKQEGESRGKDREERVTDRRKEGEARRGTSPAGTPVRENHLGADAHLCARKDSFAR